MAWDFQTDRDFETQLEWVRTFVRDEITPLELLDVDQATMDGLTAPLKEEVKRRGMWAAHLEPELGGGGWGQVKLALLHEILGTTYFAPQVFGNNAPDSGNAELLALGSTSDEQKERWLAPLLAGTLRSGFSMTEPGAGADPTMISTRAVRDGDEWVINGHKWFTSHGSLADFLLVMCVTNPDVDPRRGCSILIVPTDTPGVDVARDIGTMVHPNPQYGLAGGHAEIRYRDVRVPLENLVGAEGDGFVLAQKRLGPGRIHHAMRWLGQSRRALDMMCERAVSRFTHGSLLAEKQTIQNWVADSLTELTQARLLTLYAAWKMDNVGAADARVEIAMAKVVGAKVLYNTIDRAIQVHGSLGFSTDMPLERMYRTARGARILDGPDEVHRVTIARHTLKQYKPSAIPTEHVPTRTQAAMERFAEHLDRASLNQ
jgi:acyl-CoA dehydrogenase